MKMEPGEQSRLQRDEDEPGEQSRGPEDLGQCLRSEFGFIGGSHEQRQNYKDEEDSLYEPSISDDDQASPLPDDKPDAQQQPLPFPDCEAPERTQLLFARALPNNTTASVKGVLQDVVLYLEAHGLPVYRLHADKGETYNHSIRGWLRDKGIRATWSEPGVPPSNGQAEAVVRWVKDRARTLLTSSRLPTRLWPTAVEAATSTQRARVLGWQHKMLAPYGSTVHVKQKAFDSSGPRRRERAFESKWFKGTYVGLSNILENGHVIYIPGVGDAKEKFIHTLHARKKLVDPGPPPDEIEALDIGIVKPRRRLMSKTPIAGVEMRMAMLEKQEVEMYIKKRADLLLQEWNQDEAVKLVDELAEHNFFEDHKFGVFRHGGSVGWLRGMAEYPELARVLAKILVVANPEATFTSMIVARNMDRGMHRDFNNDENAVNYVYPIRVPKRGGDLWVELSKGDSVYGEVAERHDDKGQARYGQVYKFKTGVTTVFNPRKTHEVLPWEGTRTVLIGYTPQCLGKLDQAIVTELEANGFPVPVTQHPEYFVADDVQVSKLEASPRSQEESDSNPVNYEDGMMDSELEDWEMFIEVEDGMVKVGDGGDVNDGIDNPRIHKVEAGYTKGVEAILANLQAPLEVTYTVDPREVGENLETWRPAIEKEVDNISVAICKLLPGSEARGKWIRARGAQKLPTKMVFTVKPTDCPDLSDRSTWYKRKARLVVCGNFAEADNAVLYSETAPSESVRMGLVYSREREWAVGLIDVVAAFLRTPMDHERGDPVIIVSPPRLLEKLSLTIEGELWGLVRALYGLRQAPALWSAHRDRVLETITFPRGMRLHRGHTVTAWWILKDEKGVIRAIVIIYVDDILLLGTEEDIKVVATTIQEEWKTSNLAFLRPGAPIRFLGMELEVNGDQSIIYVNQRSYIEEVLRSYGFTKEDKDKIPLSKETGVFEVMESDVEPTPTAIAEAQRITGEVMWLAHKTRPDVAYTSCLMASLTLKAPYRCLEIGWKVLRYLNATKEICLVIRNDLTNLVLYPDAAFAPTSGRSHSGWLVCWRGTPICWRSARQPSITLSTAESELQAIIDGSIGMLGIEAMVMDLEIDPGSKVIASDSTSALAIGAGTGSWRTRHLRLKAGWIQEMRNRGEVATQHQPGIHQPADLLTKPLAAQRIRDLLHLWGLEDSTRPTSTASSTSSTSATRMLVAMVCCLMMLTVEARESTPTRTIEVDWDLAAVFMGLMMIMGALMFYEGIKWGLFEIYYQYTPGASSRRLRRLRRLREATAAAIERELERAANGMSAGLRQDGGPPRQATRESGNGQPGPPTGDLQRGRESTVSSGRARTPSINESWSPSTPPRRPTQGASTMSPGDHDGWMRSEEVQLSGGEARRVCFDTVMLMRLEEIREGLRINGLQLSGLKSDAAARLAEILSQQIGTSSGPTVRQMKYLLWLWRDRNLSGRTLLSWACLESRTEASRTIARWKFL